MINLNPLGIVVIIIVAAFLIQSLTQRLIPVNYQFQKPQLIVDQAVGKDPVFLPVYSLDAARVVIQHDFSTAQDQLFDRLRKYDGKIFLSLPFNRLLGDKQQLWNTLVSQYGRKLTTRVTPKCYVFPDDYHRYRRDKGWLILKTNQQRQQGLYLTRRHVNRETAKRLAIVVAQRYLTRPYLFKGHKINLRYYFTIRLDRYGVKSFISTDGVVTYTPKPYCHPKVDSRPQHHLCSFYHNGELYRKGFPVTVKDLSASGNSRLPDTVTHQCHDILKMTAAAYGNRVKRQLKQQRLDLGDNVCYEFFGVDFFIDHKGCPYLLEINLGPGLTPFNHSDQAVRLEAVQRYVRAIKLDSRMVSRQNPIRQSNIYDR